ncbi:MAG: Rieske 2Fe-2S domain-containing protein [Bdellovibrionota bacterium]
MQQKDVVSQLKREGFKFIDLKLKSEGNYNVADADWNYRDLLHLRHVHATDCTILSAYGDSTTQILWPTMFGVRLPMQILSFRTAANKHAAVSIWLCFALTSEDTFLRISDNWTKVVTHYQIGAPKFLSFVLPVISWLLKRSYKKLMSEDLPMRHRRGQLRFWGYRFKFDEAGYGFDKGTTLEHDEVIAPEDMHEEFPSLAIDKLLGEGQNYMLGTSDHLGIRLHRQDNKLSLYPRLCAHAGASLDESPCKSGKVRCPWHGKAFRPYAVVDLRAGTQAFTTPYHHVLFEGGVLTVKQKEAAKISIPDEAPRLEAAA